MTKRRTTYKIERVMNFGDGPELVTVLETNIKRHFCEMMDEISSRETFKRWDKSTSRTAVGVY